VLNASDGSNLIYGNFLPSCLRRDNEKVAHKAVQRKVKTPPSIFYFRSAIWPFEKEKMFFCHSKNRLLLFLDSPFRLTTIFRLSPEGEAQKEIGALLFICFHFSQASTSLVEANL
jgi:hypothetical protein